MKLLFALIGMSLVPGCVSEPIAAACPVRGEAIQWQADFCLFETGTDDLIAAQPCMDREASVRFRDACSEKQHYKQALCGLVVQAGARAGSVAQCVEDSKFSGPTVRDGGA